MGRDVVRLSNKERRSFRNKKIDALTEAVKNAKGRKARKGAKVRKLKFLGKKRK